MTDDTQKPVSVAEARKNFDPGELAIEKPEASRKTIADCVCGKSYISEGFPHGHCHVGRAFAEVLSERDKAREAYDSAIEQLEAVQKEIEELKAKPATFIKLDENTEAFMQTRAAIENMKMFQKDNRELHERFARCKQEYAKELQTERAKVQELEAEKIGLLQLIDGQAKENERLTEKGIRNSTAAGDWSLKCDQWQSLASGLAEAIKFAIEQYTPGMTKTVLCEALAEFDRLKSGGK